MEYDECACFADKKRLSKFREDSLSSVVKNAAILRYKDKGFRRELLDEVIQVNHGED